MRDPTVPLVAMTFAFNGGANQDPEVKPGVSYLTAALLDDGAGELDAKAFQQRLEENAVQLRFSSGRDNFQGSLTVLRDNLDQGLDLLRLALTQPRFDNDALERVRAQVVSALRRETTNPNSISNRRLVEDGVPEPSLRPADQRHAGIGADHHRATTCATIIRAC